MKNQAIQTIDIRDLILWTENPRDPIDKNASDQDILHRAMGSKKWDLDKLAAQMGDYYDLSELPTVVYHGTQPVVYDGNRRILLGKLYHKLLDIPASSKKKKLQLPTFPKAIPCNVCDPKMALQNIYRKHSNTGSWRPLERDIFLAKHMREEKSPFLLLEENTGMISAHDKALNQRFVKEEIFTPAILDKLGLSFQGEKLMSIHSDKETKSLLAEVVAKIVNKEISTRKNRGKEILELVRTTTEELLERNKDNQPTECKLKSTSESKNEKTKTTPRTLKKDPILFGKKLSLERGKVNDIYKDICCLYNYYSKEKSKLSNYFPSFIRMALRLLCETAAKEQYPDEKNKALEILIQANFATAKQNLTQDQRTTLHTQQTETDTKILTLLHIGAHNYTASHNINQTIAMSIIIGAMLEYVFLKDNQK